jgi:hypothetical protein
LVPPQEPSSETFAEAEEVGAEDVPDALPDAEALTVEDAEITEEEEEPGQLPKRGLQLASQ